MESGVESIVTIDMAHALGDKLPVTSYPDGWNDDHRRWARGLDYLLTNTERQAYSCGERLKYVNKRIKDLDTNHLNKEYSQLMKEWTSLGENYSKYRIIIDYVDIIYLRIRWKRHVIVTTYDNGHIHKDKTCGTLNHNGETKTEMFSPGSAMEEEELVENFGELCGSCCYKSAPVSAENYNKIAKLAELYSVGKIDMNALDRIIRYKLQEHIKRADKKRKREAKKALDLFTDSETGKQMLIPSVLANSLDMLYGTRTVRFNLPDDTQVSAIIVDKMRSTRILHVRMNYFLAVLGESSKEHPAIAIISRLNREIRSQLDEKEPNAKRQEVKEKSINHPSVPWEKYVWASVQKERLATLLDRFELDYKKIVEEVKKRDCKTFD